MPEFKVTIFGFYRVLLWGRHNRKELFVFSTRCVELELRNSFVVGLENKPGT